MIPATTVVLDAHTATNSNSTVATAASSPTIAASTSANTANTTTASTVTSSATTLSNIACTITSSAAAFTASIHHYLPTPLSLPPPVLPQLSLPPPFSLLSHPIAVAATINSFPSQLLPHP
ncbi:hypothetical protein Vretimale_15699 [Volvox reticuliferus]|uniref:Uncharacterized protein n=1 Tax=Volvox reticuliferus TaxID=1737510 RepID=A0A8J4GRC4_9CHLO|nr:hypothetical protein Vretifemale_18381 [Volvox reticuliferus]GIM12340.1 hypothetical protein Vretimale_15699 [Volvox reticuliferus]